MPSSEYLYFAEKFRTAPFDNPRRIGYARLRQLQEERITSEDAGCPGVLQHKTRIGNLQAEWLVPEGCPGVSYTHLTLPAGGLKEDSGGAGAL